MTQVIQPREIRKGDRIRTTKKFPETGGVTETVIREGVAYSVDEDGDWQAEGGLYVHTGTNGGSSQITIELLERALPTELGAVFRATQIQGEKCDVFVFVRRYGERDTERVYVSSEQVRGTVNHYGFQIQEWEPINAPVS